VREGVPGTPVDEVRASPKYFARKKGVTWLNMISDQRIGLAGRVISGTPKDTLHFVDLVFNPDSDRRPENDLVRKTFDLLTRSSTLQDRIETAERRLA
jgi:hypothetical protein